MGINFNNDNIQIIRGVVMAQGDERFALYAVIKMDTSNEHLGQPFYDVYSISISKGEKPVVTAFVWPETAIDFARNMEVEFSIKETTGWKAVTDPAEIYRIVGADVAAAHSYKDVIGEEAGIYKRTIADRANYKAARIFTP